MAKFWGMRSSPVHQEDSIWVPHQYRFDLVADVPVTILPANDSRRYLLLQNISDTIITFSLDGTDAVTNGHPQLAAEGGSYELSRVGQGVPVRSVSAIHSGVGAKILVVIEGRTS